MGEGIGGMPIMPGVENGPGNSQYSVTEAGADTLKKNFESEVANNVAEKKDAATLERQKKFDSIAIGSTITVKENGEMVQHVVTGKNPQTLGVSWEMEGDGNSTYGSTVAVENVLDIMNPKTQN